MQACPRKPKSEVVELVAVLIQKNSTLASDSGSIETDTKLLELIAKEVKLFSQYLDAERSGDEVKQEELFTELKRLSKELEEFCA